MKKGNNNWLTLKTKELVFIQSSLNFFKQSKSISTVKKSHFLARIPKPTKDKIIIKRFEEERKEFSEKEKDAEN